MSNKDNWLNIRKFYFVKDKTNKTGGKIEGRLFEGDGK